MKFDPGNSTFSIFPRRPIADPDNRIFMALYPNKCLNPCQQFNNNNNPH